MNAVDNHMAARDFQSCGKGFDHFLVRAVQEGAIIHCRKAKAKVAALENISSQKERIAHVRFLLILCETEVYRFALRRCDVDFKCPDLQHSIHTPP